MSLKGGQDRYGAVAIAVHWLSALAIALLLVLGFMAASAEDPARKAALLRFHVPLGALTLLLTLFRIGWLFVDRRPARLPDMPSWQGVAESVTHFGLYALVVLVGVSGVGLVVLSGAAAPLFFGAPRPLPDFQTYVPFIVHATGAFILIGLIALHIAAALYHQLIRRDHVLSRIGIGAVR
jgi:cytochrome b561